MKFERIPRVRTPDGVEHENSTAAREHMLRQACRQLGEATSADFEDIAVAGHGNVDGLREALRDVFLATWPRASKGKPKPRQSKGK